MGDPPPASAPKPCCVCAQPSGKHCNKCKSRHYCGKICQTDVLGLGPCGALYFQDRLDSLFAEKLKTEEEALGARCAVDDVVPANGLNAAPRASAVPTAMTADVTATAANADTPDWRGTCGICLERLLFVESKCFLACCCKPEEICAECSEKCLQHDNRCPLCRTPALKSHAEMLRRLQTQVDKGNAEAQAVLGNAYRSGDKGLEKNLKRAFQLFKFAAAQGDAEAQSALGEFYKHGHGVEIDFEAALMWFQRAAEQGYHAAQSHLGYIFSNGQGVVQSFAISQKPKSGTASRRSKATQRLLTTSACIMQEAKACRRTSTRRCASASAPQPRGTPALRRWSKESNSWSNDTVVESKSPPSRPTRRSNSTLLSSVLRTPGHPRWPSFADAPAGAPAPMVGQS